MRHRDAGTMELVHEILGFLIGLAIELEDINDATITDPLEDVPMSCHLDSVALCLAQGNQPRAF